MKTIKIFVNYKLVGAIESPTLLSGMDRFRRDNPSMLNVNDTVTALSGDDGVCKGLAFSCVVAGDGRLSGVTETLDEGQAMFDELSNQTLAESTEAESGFIRVSFEGDHSGHKLFRRDGLYYISDYSGYAPNETDDGLLSILLNKRIEMINNYGSIAYALPVWSVREQAECIAIIGDALAKHCLHVLKMKKA